LPGFIAPFKKKWNLDKEITLAHTLLGHMEKKIGYTLSEALTYRMHFRLRGIFHNIYCEHMVKPALQEIPWSGMKDYPLSFLYDNCDMWEEVGELVKLCTGRIHE
jgi:hypothetical protein